MARHHHISGGSAAARHKAASKANRFRHRVLQLNIDIMCANSPQGKGCLERANLTLPSCEEATPGDISTIDAANAYAAEFAIPSPPSIRAIASAASRPKPQSSAASRAKGPRSACSKAAHRPGTRALMLQPDLLVADERRRSTYRSRRRSALLAKRKESKMTSTINYTAASYGNDLVGGSFETMSMHTPRSRFRRCDMQFVHCNICGDRYDPVVGHLLLPDAMPTLNAVHLLPRCISNRAHCHLLPAVGFFFV
ncbi:hypothetical protein [Mesorhizobium sp.]|uniref:hypothetical protein n=1 Tax=Mesorhizobium sp. TaxID=1871066 RepID=UPI00257C0147|nr:hypothetical protein [Mesorhizobium sp.]